MKPNLEQAVIIDSFEQGDNSVITAGAGTGKSTVLKMCANEVPRWQGGYIVYNAAMAKQAKASMPRHVKCGTAHSFAFGSVGKLYKESGRLDSPRQSGKQQASILKIRDSFKLAKEVYLGPDGVARVAMETVQRFCQTADKEITVDHVPWVEGIEDYEVYAALKESAVKYAKKAWDDLQLVRGGKLKFLHDHYLKIWALGDPVLPYDYIAVDEAQDSNGVIIGVVLSQDCQQIAVGDENQALYEWRGAQNAMATWPSDVRLKLTQSYRFGPAVAEEANKWLEVLGSDLRIKGFDAIDSTVGTRIEEFKPDAVLCRTNAQAVAEAVAAQDQGVAVALVGGTREIEWFTRDAAKLQAGIKVEHPDLMAFENWGAVQTYVEKDKAGADLRVKVKLIDEYGAQKVLDICSKTVPEDRAELVVSTAHKAKGLEWNSVRIAPDFPVPKSADENPSRPDCMLAYVAVTRAKYGLDNDGLSWVDQYVRPTTLTTH